MAIQETLSVKLTADTTQYTKAMKKAAESTKSFQREAGDIKAPEGLNDLRTKVDALRTRNKELRDGLAQTGKAAAEAGAKGVQAAKASGGAITIALGPLGIVLGVIAAIIAALKALLALQKKIVQTAVTGIKKTLSVINKVVKAVNGFYVGAIKKIYEAVKGLIAKVNSGDLDNLYNWAKGSGHSIANNFDQIASALMNIKNSIAALMAPILNVLGPALQWLAQRFIDVANAASKFVAALSGKGTFIRVKEAAVEFGDNATQSMNNATQAAQEYKRELMGFDEIHKLSDQSGTTPGGNDDGGGGGGDYSSMFEEVSTEGQSAAEVFKDFLDSIEKGLPSFSEKLQQMAGSINEWAKAFKETFADEGLQEQVTRVTAGIAEALNDFVDSVDFYAIGEALAAGLNTAFNALTTFINTFDWVNLGAKLAGFVNGLVSGIDGEYLGELLVAPFNIAFKTLEGFTGELDFGNLGEKVATALNTAIKTIDTQALVNTVHNVLTGLPSFIETFLTTFDADAAKTKITTTLTSLIRTIVNDLPNAVGSVIDLAETLVGVLTDAINDVPDSDWQELGYTLFSAFLDIKSSEKKLKKSIGDTILKVLSGAASGGMEKLKEEIATDWERIKTQAKGKWEQIKKAVGTKAGQIWGYISGKFATLKDKVAGVWTSIKEKAKKIWEQIKSAISTKAGQIWGYVKEKFTTFKENVAGVWRSVREKAVTLWQKIKEAIGTKAGQIWGYIKQPFVDLADNIRDKWDKICSTAKSWWQVIKDAIWTKLSNLWNYIKTPFETVRDEIRDKWDGICSTAKSWWQTIKDGIWTKVSNLWSYIKSPFETVRDSVKGIWEDIIGWIDDIWGQADSLSTHLTNGEIFGGGGGEFAAGGYPATGQMFIAREAGPELVGTIGNRTAVVNNDQIVSAVSAGVANAVAAVLGGGGGATEVNVYMDSQSVAKAAFKGQQKLNRRFNVVALV